MKKVTLRFFPIRKKEKNHGRQTCIIPGMVLMALADYKVFSHSKKGEKNSRATTLHQSGGGFGSFSCKFTSKAPKTIPGLVQSWRPRSKKIIVTEDHTTI